MAKVIEWNRAAPTCSIPLELAVHCVNCKTISNSRPHTCAVCGSEAVLRVQLILDPGPEPSAAQRRALKVAYTHAVTNGLFPRWRRSYRDPSKGPLAALFNGKRGFLNTGRLPKTCGVVPRRGHLKDVIMLPNEIAQSVRGTSEPLQQTTRKDGRRYAQISRI
jgi:RNA polymerase subunit RPABC4/transcription elongation factor Spt4